MFVSCSAKENQKGRQKQHAHARVWERQTTFPRAWASACVCLFWVLSEKCHCCSESEAQTPGSPAPTSTLTETGRERRGDNVIWEMIFIPPVKLIIPSTIDSQHTNNILYSHLKLSKVIKAVKEVRMGHYKLSKRKSFRSSHSCMHWNQGCALFTGELWDDNGNLQ